MNPTIMNELVFATNNINKRNEVQSMLPAGLVLKHLPDVGFFEDIPETAATLEGNALLKARRVFEVTGLPSFADDTGLEVPALNGAPGVYSARYAGPEGNALANMQKLLRELENKDRRARFRTVIAFCTREGESLYEGIVEGEITMEMLGEKGFGYDPLFRPLGSDQTFAQMDPVTKNAISHRGRAFRAFLDALNR